MLKYIFSFILNGLILFAVCYFGPPVGWCHYLFSQSKAVWTLNNARTKDRYLVIHRVRPCRRLLKMLLLKVHNDNKHRSRHCCRSGCFFCSVNLKTSFWFSRFWFLQCFWLVLEPRICSKLRDVFKWSPTTTPNIFCFWPSVSPKHCCCLIATLDVQLWDTSSCKE